MDRGGGGHRTGGSHRTNGDERTGGDKRGAGATVVVVGAGVVGSWTALHLARAGAQVTLIDLRGPGNPLQTSGGHSRGIRIGYGEDALMSRWALRSAHAWAQAEVQSGVSFLTQTGRLVLGQRWTQALEAQTRILEALGVEQARLTPEEVARRWPLISPLGFEVAHYEPGAQMVRADRAVQAVAALGAGEGVVMRLGRASFGLERGGRLLEIQVDEVDADRVQGTQGMGTASAPGRRSRRGSRTLGADAFVWACGPWLPHLFSVAVGRRIVTPRREVHFFSAGGGAGPGTPAGLGPVAGPGPGPGAIPGFHEDDVPEAEGFGPGPFGIYGFPPLEGAGLKLAPFGGIEAVDPETTPRQTTAAWQDVAARYLARRFPALAGARWQEGRVCVLENTANEDFILDRYPGLENVWIAGGGSGHAFKHGPELGQWMAEEVLGRRSGTEAEEVLGRRSGTEAGEGDRTTSGESGPEDPLEAHSLRRRFSLVSPHTPVEIEQIERVR